MKEYFFLKGNDQNGPYTIEQLADKELTSETLVWTDGLNNWTKLKDVPELVQALKPKSVPPPPPIFNDERISKTEVSGQLKVTGEKNTNSTLEAITPDKKVLTWLIVWCGFHLFALLTSYSRISLFNNEGKPQTSEFWPFVNFNNTFYTGEQMGRGFAGGPEGSKFNGYFVQYDWTEFAFYSGAAIVIFVLVRISTNPEESKIKN